MNTVWRKYLSPEVLFFLGFLQALLPYLFWQFEWGLDLIRWYSFAINYQPMVLWISAYIAFWGGCKLVDFANVVFGKPLSKNIQVYFFIHPNRWRLLMILMILALLVQIVLAIQLYGVVPIVAFASGSYSIDMVNQQQLSGNFGQFGMLLLSSITLSALILAGFINEHKLLVIDKYLVVLALLIAIFVSIFQGKRQALFMLASFLLSGLALAKGRIISPVLEKLYSRRLSKKQTFVLASVVLAFFIFVMGFISSLRYGSVKDYTLAKSINEISFYLSLPLLNLHAELDAAGWDGFQFSPKGLFFGLLPYRMREQLSDTYIDYPMPQLERSCGAGFLGNVHWEVGFWGMIAFCVLVGALCKSAYLKSVTSLFWLLVYCQTVWTLIAAHTYNHFITLLYFPVPVVVYLFVSIILVPKTALSGIKAKAV